MNTLRRMVCSGTIVISANLFTVLYFLQAADFFKLSAVKQGMLFLFFTGAVLWIVCHPQRKREPVPEQLSALSDGCELLRLFVLSVGVTAGVQIVTAYQAYMGHIPWHKGGTMAMLLCYVLGLLGAAVYEGMVFWAGMVRVYMTSVQLGIKQRILAAVCGWIPVVNCFYLSKIIHVVQSEVAFETKKLQVNRDRASQQVCKTRYPILLVHGVFFRDVRYLNYWGRIPKELVKNGAVLYYGEQESAASVAYCGREIAERIRNILAQSGSEKINIIAHSKGGLDCREAISHCGAAPYVASLTTINTPHEGCLFAEYLLNSIPKQVRQAAADTYNKTLKKLGDRAPDFLSAAWDLTETACAERNKNTPDAPGVLYESVMSYCKKARGGKFPLNISYPLVKHLNGENDGLVAAQSAQWGERFTLLKPQSDRGISHGDMIDLNRENILGFDVREFYVSLVSDLKKRGY